MQAFGWVACCYLMPHRDAGLSPRALWGAGGGSVGLDQRAIVTVAMLLTRRCQQPPLTIRAS